MSIMKNDVFIESLFQIPGTLFTFLSSAMGIEYAASCAGCMADVAALAGNHPDFLALGGTLRTPNTGHL